MHGHFFYTVYYEDHDGVMKHCRFQINPVYENDIIQEIRPTGNQTWVRDCANGTESINSCPFCIVPLHCNCWLQTDDQYLAETLDTCVIKYPWLKIPIQNITKGPPEFKF